MSGTNKLSAAVTGSVPPATEVSESTEASEAVSKPQHEVNESTMEPDTSEAPEVT